QPRPPAPRRRAAGRSRNAARRPAPSTELLQDADVVLEELAEIRDPVLEHGDPLDSHPKCEPLYLLGVIAALPHEAEHVRVHHSCPEDLDPADPLAERVAGAIRQLAATAAAKAGDVDLHTRLRERE